VFSWQILKIKVMKQENELLWRIDVGMYSFGFKLNVDPTFSVRGGGYSHARMLEAHM
jgi:hypothetical protein